jgi:hypothetical protein
MPSGYRPYSSYRPDFSSRLPDIIMEGARAQSEAQRQKAAVWQNAIGQIGQIAGQTIQEEGKRKEEEKRAAYERQRVAQFGEVVQSAEDPRQVLGAALQLWGPEKGIEITKGYMAMDEMARQRAAAEQDARLKEDAAWKANQMDLMRAASGAYLKLNPAGREMAYSSIRDRVLPELMSITGMTPEQAQHMFPEQWSPEADQQLEASLKGGPWTPEPIKVGEGEALVDPTTGAATIPAPKAEKPDTRGFEARIADAIANGDTEEAQRLRNEYAALQAAGRAPDKPEAGQVIQTDQGPMLVDRATGQARPITAGGQQVKGKPTTSGSGGGAAKGMSAVLDSIDELSKKINTSSGISAKFGGQVAKARAATNYDDDLSEYSALVQGFTPMVARAVGHTGVLTEQDVQSVRALFPNPGDSKSIRDRKMKRIRSIMAAVNQDRGGGQENAQGEQDPLGIRQ